MWYRIGAVRNMTGGRKTQPATKMNDRLKEVLFFDDYIYSDILVLFRQYSILYKMTQLPTVH